MFPDVGSITDASNVIATSQLALPEEECTTVYTESGYDGSTRNLSGVTLAGDNVFGDDAAERQLATMTGDVASGYTATLVVGVDTTTTPAAGSAPGVGGPSGGGAPPAR